MPEKNDYQSAPKPLRHNYFWDAYDLIKLPRLKTVAEQEDVWIHRGDKSNSFIWIADMAPKDAVKKASENLVSLRRGHMELCTIDYLAAETVLLLKQAGETLGSDKQMKLREEMKKAYVAFAKEQIDYLEEAKHDHSEVATGGIVTAIFNAYIAAGVELPKKRAQEIKELGDTYARRHAEKRASRRPFLPGPRF